MILTRAILLIGLAASSAVVADDFAAYSQEIPHTDQAIDMAPITGGSFTMGSPEAEVGRTEAEGPRHEVIVGDFWMGKYEINWQQYELFVYRDKENFRKFVPQDKLDALAIDGVSGATAPYVEMSYGMGKDGYPAINITQYAALQYARWLSAKTGRFYRLPTEAEWEYACRAGTTSPWSFGSDPAKAANYAIFADNSDEHYAQVGSREPNPWQLYDMHGNVAEWTMDQFHPTFYSRSESKNPWNRPKDLYPRVVRGGSWVDPVDQLRCAARRPSTPNWKERDPQIPMSPWWLTNAPFVGFRLVSPREMPSADEIERYWLEAIEDYGT